MGTSPHSNAPLQSLAAIIVAAVICISSSDAAAECSDLRVQRLARQGETIGAISRICDISRKEVQFILAEDESEDETGEAEVGLIRGTPVGQCGCWGYVAPGFQQPHPGCRSGYAIATRCGGFCPGGGYAWQGVCS